MSAHDDYLDPTLRDDTSARVDDTYCPKCDDRLLEAGVFNADTCVELCDASEADPDEPKCLGCCDCPDCASDRCSAAHTPGTGQWYAA